MSLAPWKVNLLSPPRASLLVQVNLVQASARALPQRSPTGSSPAWPSFAAGFSPCSASCFLRISLITWESRLGADQRSLVPLRAQTVTMPSGHLHSGLPQCFNHRAPTNVPGEDTRKAYGGSQCKASSCLSIATSISVCAPAFSASQRRLVVSKRCRRSYRELQMQ